jgi:hypothetical protein
VKLTPASSELAPLAGRYAKRPPPKRPNRPHIPSKSTSSKNTKTQINKPHYNVQPSIHAFRDLSASLPCAVAFGPFRFHRGVNRFGEALLTDGRRNPQGEKAAI